MDTPTAGPIRVVLKRMKPRVPGAAAFFDAEHLLNVYAARKARGGVASFYGFVDVPAGAAGRQLTAGTWLVWRYEGGRTLAEFLRRRDCEAALAEALGLSEADASTPGVLAATVTADVLAALAGLHGAGVVHRDVKPANLILAEAPPGGWPAGEGGGGPASSSSRARRRTTRPTPPPPRPRLLLIDLGAAADLRYGTNFDPEESVLDPLYAPPEKFVLPSEQAPSLADTNGLLASRVLSPLLWGRWRPDAFDAYSAGLVLLQAALPRLRSPAGLRAFNTALARAGGDLGAWRAGARLAPAEAAALDAGGGAGWDLAASLLAPRAGVEVTPAGGVSFGDGASATARPTAAAALRHPFITRLAVPVRSRRPVAQPQEAGARVAATVTRGGSSSGSAGGGSSGRRGGAPTAASTPASPRSAAGLLTGTAAAVWKAATQRLFALEGRLLAQSEAVTTQTTRVQVAAAQAAVAGGDAATAAALAAEEAALAAEQAKLAGLTTDFEATAAAASEQLEGLLLPPGGGRRGGGGGGAPSPAARARAALAVDQGAAATPAPPPPPAAPAVASALTSAAVGGLAGALRWTGTALRVATALASQVADGAARAAEEEAERVAALKVDREAGLAFVEALKALDPPPPPGADWEADVRPRLARDERVTRVSPTGGAALWAAYASARAKAAASAAARAEAGFKAALAAAAIPAAVPWADARRLLGAHPATAAATRAGLDPGALYAACQAASRDEAAFRDLVAETIATTRRGAPWRALRPSICDDARFGPVPELRRRELFAAARAAHDAAAATAEAAEAEAAAVRSAEAKKVADAAAVAAASAAAVFDPEEPEGGEAGEGASVPPILVDGPALAAEQAALREAYEKMEAKLKVMEAALASATKGGSRVPGAVEAAVEDWVAEVEEEM